MHRIHAGLTVIVPVKEGNKQKLSDLLKHLNKNGRKHIFYKSHTTLFAAGVIIPDQEYHTKDDKLPESLVFATTYCGPLAAHLDDLWKTNQKNLCDIFSYCQGLCPNADKKQFIAFIKKYSKTGSFTSRFNLITKEEVRLEKELRENIENYIDKAQKICAFDNIKPTEVKTLIYRHVKSFGDDYGWALKPFRKTLWEWLYVNKVKIFMVALISLLFFLLAFKTFLISIIVKILIVLALLVLAILVNVNREKTPSAFRPSDDRVREIAATQLNPVTNGMTAAAPLKKGIVRRYFYAFVLKAAGLFYKANVPTVSSIRWLSVDNRKRLLFLSNYSNTTDFYVRDFLIGKTPYGVNFMFSNGMGFPDACLSIFGGIRENPEGYMNAVHTGQHVMDLWYTHENELTVDMINRNRNIRNGLAKEMNENEASEWLRLL